MTKLVLATRKSPLAMAQTELVAAQLSAKLPGISCEILKVVTTGDRQRGWSLEKEGGKGLFTAELEQALLRGEAGAAVHSSKDLPGEATPGLTIAGYLAREDPRDVLVLRAGVRTPLTIATSSPRRRLQIARTYPGAAFVEIRGNVDTRLTKIASGDADASVLAAAGLKRLGIEAWPGVEFHVLEFRQMVPAVGQGAIAVQCRTGDAPQLAPALDAPTARQLGIERALQQRLAGGCQTAFGAHVAGEMLYLFHEHCGVRTLALTAADFEQPAAAAERILKSLGIV